jgi:hypothetical protein
MANYESNVWKAQTGTSGGVSGTLYGRKAQYTAASVKFTVEASGTNTVQLAKLPVGAIVVSVLFHGRISMTAGTFRLGPRSWATGLAATGNPASTSGTPAANAFLPVSDTEEEAGIEANFTSGVQDFTVVIGWISPTAS